MKKTLFSFIVFILLFYLSGTCFLYVEAGNDEQPKVCNGPSEMMSNYFDFQLEMKKALLGTEMNSVRFSASFGPGGLFTNRVLDLHTTSAIELLSSSIIANLRSFVSNSITSMFLVELAVFSVIQSNTEGFAILFADWPIVRDYKKMLDIETEIFDLAYYASKQIDLTRPISPDSAKKVDEVIKKYKDKGLLTGSNNGVQGSMGDILLDLTQMNAVMKQFIMVGGESIGNAGLRKYKGCLGNVEEMWCTDENAILMFNSDSVAQLYDDYHDVRGPFGGCNLYGNNIKGVLKKTVKNNSDSVSQAMQDVVDALGRLWNQTLWNKNRWDFHDPCKDLSEYEMAQLEAYWGGNWQCGYGINLFTAEKYLKEKSAHMKQKKKMKKLANSAEIGSLNDNMKKSWDSSQRAQLYRKTIGTGNLSKFYDFELGLGFEGVFEMTMEEYSQAQENAVSTDIRLFPQIKQLLDQVEKTNKSAKNLYDVLKEIEGIQCSR